MTGSYETKLNDDSLTLHIFEVALLVGVQTTSDPKAPLRGWLSDAASRSVKIGAHQASAASIRVRGELGAQLVRMVDYYSAKPGEQQIWFIPFSSFGTVDDMQQAATRIK